MTTIAWDSRQLVGDRGHWSGEIVYEGRKVFKIAIPLGTLRQALVGFTGQVDDGLQALGWMKAGMNPDRLPVLGPRREGRRENLAIVIMEGGEVSFLSDTFVLTPIHDRIAALGGGAAFALGAMAAGRTAAEAVELARRYTDYARHGSDMVEF